MRTALLLSLVLLSTQSFALDRPSQLPHRFEIGKRGDRAWPGGEGDVFTTGRLSPEVMEALRQADAEGVMLDEDNIFAAPGSPDGSGEAQE